MSEVTFLPIADKPTLDETKLTIEDVKAIVDARLDANVSSRQANWGATTTHRDRIDTTISSRATQTTVNTINSNVGSNSDSSSASGSVHAKLKELRSQVINSGGGIKSVQRGYTSFDLATGGSTQDINISTVNMSKSILIQSSRGDGNSYSIILVNSTTIRITNRTANVRIRGSVDWEVVEFN